MPWTRQERSDGAGLYGKMPCSGNARKIHNARLREPTEWLAGQTECATRS